MTAFHWRY